MVVLLLIYLFFVMIFYFLTLTEVDNLYIPNPIYELQIRNHYIKDYFLKKIKSTIIILVSH